MVPGRLLAVGCEYQRPSAPGLTLNLQIESVHPVSGLAALWCLSRAAGEFCLRYLAKRSAGMEGWGAGGGGRWCWGHSPPSVLLMSSTGVFSLTL